MGLIKNKIKKWYENIGLKLNQSKKNVSKKVGAGLLLTTMGVTSLFGFVGCSNQTEKPPVTDTTKEEIEMLKEMVKSLSLLASQLESSDEINAKINALNERIVELEAKKNVEEGTLTEALNEVKGLIAAIQAEVNLIKDRLTVLENKSEITPEAKPSIDQETLIKLENELAKVKARLAIQSGFEGYYNHLQFGDGYDGYTAPNADVVVDRNLNNDYAYFNSEKKMAFMSNNGDEAFMIEDSVATIFDFSKLVKGLFEDEGFVLDKQTTSENSYVFVNEEGETITIEVDQDAMSNFNYIAGSETSSLNVKVERSNRQEFENALESCKQALKSIGLFESYKKSLDNSLQYKYAEILSTYVHNGYYETHEMTGMGVFSGCEGATEQKGDLGNLYSILKKSEYYTCKLDEEGNVLAEEGNDDEQEDIAQSFRDMCTPRKGEVYYKIALDEETGTYTLQSYSDDDTFESKIEIKFNADLSIDCKNFFENEVITYHIKEIGIERYNEVFLRINEICEQAKQQTNGLTQ